MEEHLSSTTSEAIVNWYGKQPQSNREHLGASIIGDPCERKIWLTWRWAKTPSFDGRILRLFEYGKKAEERIFEEMRAAGIKVWNVDETSGNQWSVSALGGHFKGSLDAVCQEAPELPNDACVVEVKTHNEKSFKELLKSGVKKAKPVHWAQFQIYCKLMGLGHALYVAENKNDSAIYTELVEADDHAADLLLAKADRIIKSTTPPPRIGDASTMDCKWCSFKDLCHGTEIAEVNCRTCANYTPELDGDARWSCSENRQADPSKGCSRHLYIPPLLDTLGEPIDGGVDYVIYRDKAGAEFVNGPGPNFSSLEIRAGKHLVKDETVQGIKQEIKTATLTASAFDDMESDDLDAVPTKKARKEK